MNYRSRFTEEKLFFMLLLVQKDETFYLKIADFMKNMLILNHSHSHNKVC